MEIYANNIVFDGRGNDYLVMQSEIREKQGQCIKKVYIVCDAFLHFPIVNYA